MKPNAIELAILREIDHGNEFMPQSVPYIIACVLQQDGYVELDRVSGEIEPDFTPKTLVWVKFKLTEAGCAAISDPTTG